MKKKEKILIVIVIMGIVFTILGSTLAYWNWSTTEAEKTNVVFTITNNFSCAADGGGNITSGDLTLIPTTVTDATSNNYIKREVKVKPSLKIPGVNVYMDLWLDIKDIGSGLSNSDNFRYAFTTSPNSPTEGVITSGNFKGKSAGNKINLLSGKDYNTTTTDPYYLWIWLDAAETSSSTMNQSFSLSLNGSCTDHAPITANSLIANANPSTLMYAAATEEQKGNMWTFSHDATAQTEALTDYRYIGSRPNNYINFNNETWRIIGIFDGRIKIIRDDFLGDMYWDYKLSGIGSSTTDHGSNDWTDSQLMYMLNPTTYKLKDSYILDGNYIKDASGNIIYQLGCQPASIATGATSYSCTSNTWILNSTALSQISETTYYLGGSSYVAGFGASYYYNFERGETVYSGRQTNWSGLVGLMYPSDYAYTFANGVDDTCYSDTYNCSTATPSSSWLYKSGVYQWTVSPVSRDAHIVFIVSSSGRANSDIADHSDGARPVVYLKSDIQLSGSGTETEPYEIISWQ